MKAGWKVGLALLGIWVASAQNDFDIVIDLDEQQETENGDKFSLEGGSTCSLKYKELPYKLSCTIDSVVDAEGDGLPPLKISANFGITITKENVEDGDINIVGNYGVHIDSFDVPLVPGSRRMLGWLDDVKDWFDDVGNWFDGFADDVKSGTESVLDKLGDLPQDVRREIETFIKDNAKLHVPALTVPQDGSGSFEIVLTKERLEKPICLANDIIAWVPTDLAALITFSSSVSGSDLCFLLKDLQFDAVNDGAMMKVILNAHVLDSTKQKYLSDEVFKKIRGYLNIKHDIVHIMDLGKLSFKSLFSAGSRRQLSNADVVDQDGNFRMGSAAGANSNSASTTPISITLVCLGVFLILFKQ